MKPYLVTTGLLFAALTVAHVCRVVAEWPRAARQPGFALEMAVGIVLPVLLAAWAFRLLRNLSRVEGKSD